MRSAIHVLKQVPRVIGGPGEPGSAWFVTNLMSTRLLRSMVGTGMQFKPGIHSSSRAATWQCEWSMHSKGSGEHTSRSQTGVTMVLLERET